MARASEKQWQGRRSRAMGGYAPFVVKLCQSYRQLTEVTDDSHWVVLVERTADFVKTLRSSTGDYPDDRYTEGEREPSTSLMMLASAACLFGLAPDSK